VFRSKLNYYASASKTSRRAPVPCGTDRDAHHVSASGSEHTRHPFPALTGLEWFVYPRITSQGRQRGPRSPTKNALLMCSRNLCCHGGVIVCCRAIIRDNDDT
jgi:hypothetical protein